MAFYNNPGNYPAAYAPYFQPQGNPAITWVQGEAAAKSWYVAPGSTAALWDSEAQTIYIKTADAPGVMMAVPTMMAAVFTAADPTRTRTAGRCATAAEDATAWDAISATLWRICGA